MKKLGAFIADNLYGGVTELKVSHIVHLKIYEFFMIYKVIYLSWFWGFYTLKITDVVLPLGIATILDISFMHGNNLPLINAGIISIICAIAFFRKGPNWLYMIAFVLLHFQYVARFSIGEIPHSANLIGMALFAFAVGILVFEDKLARYRFIIGISLFYIGWGYFTASMSKLIGTGITWIDGRHLWLWIAEKGTDILGREGAFDYTIVQSIALNSIPAASLMLFVGIATEFIGPLIWFRKTRAFTTLALIGMHFGVMLSMNIRFDAFMIQLIIVGFLWPEWFERFKPQIKSLFGKVDQLPV